MLLVNGLRVGIGLVLRVPGAIILQRDQFPVGSRDAPVLRPVAVLRVRILVVVVAKVQDCIEVRPAGQAGIGVEVALRQVRARHHAEADTRHVFPRQRPGSSNGGLLAIGLEAVVIRRRRLEAAGVELHREVARRAGLDFTAGNGGGELRIARQLPRHRLGAARAARRDPRAQDDSIVQRITARHAVPEHRVGHLCERIDRSHQRQRAKRRAAALEEASPGNRAHGRSL